MSDVLSAELLEEIRRNTPATVVGGPVTIRRTTTGVDTIVSVCGGEHGDDGNDDDDGGGGGGGVSKAAGVGPAGAGGAAGFDEFVLCSVFRAPTMNERGACFAKYV